MRGDFLHNEVLIAPLAGRFASVGATVHLEYHVPLEDGYGAIDLAAEFPLELIAVEAETSADRVGNDLRKAAAANASELWIVTPNVRIARQTQRRLARERERMFFAGPVFVLTLGQSLQRVTNCLLKMTPLKDDEKSRNQADGPPATRGRSRRTAR